MEQINDALMEEADLLPEETPTQEPQQEAEAPAEAAPADRGEEFAEFRRRFPDLDADRIPTSVWQAVGRGETLLSAWQGHRMQQLEGENARLQEQLQMLQQQADARSRSLGSVRTAGSAARTDGFLLGFEEA